MQGRIGTLHLRYRIPAGFPALGAAVRTVDRALENRLGEVLAERLERALGRTETVVVLRETRARLALSPADLTLESGVADQVGRALTDAVTDMLAQSPGDGIARFENQAEYIGCFIVDLLHGAAWDRWYYGAFQRYRRPEPRDTILALLEDESERAVQVFAWLDRREELDRVMTLLGAGEMRRLAAGDGAALASDAAPADLTPLLDAALRILRACGHPAGNEAAAGHLLERFLSTRPVPPAWSDRRALSAWVLAAVRFVVRDAGDAGALDATSRELAALLAGSLDWLDGPWLLEELAPSHVGVPAGAPAVTAGLLPSPYLAMLRRLTARIRKGGVRIDSAADADTALSRLLVALGDELRGPPDRTLLAALERVVEAARAGPGNRRAVADLGLEAAELLEQIAPAALASSDPSGLATDGAGLYLLTRALQDTRVLSLAAALGIPQSLVLGRVAAELLGLTPPLDPAVALWVGDPAEPALGQVGELAEPFSALCAALAETLAAQGCAVPEAAGLDVLVCRAWARWLPGLADSSPTFLVANCLRRNARATISDAEVILRMAPAPLDVVVEMAGYFAPIGQVPWLDRRTVRFNVDRSLG